MPKPTHTLPRFPGAQQGSVLVQFALLALILFAILGIVQIGHMYSTKRDLQRIADLAALESVNGFQAATICTDALAAGTRSITKQWPPDVTARNNNVECGNWNTERGFVSGLGLNGMFNAVRVTLNGETLKLVPFTANRTVQAIATAAMPNDPVAEFSVGAGVVKLQNGLLNALLSSLLGTKIDLSAVDYEGMANTKVKLLWMAEALNVNAGDYNALLNTAVDMKSLLKASIKAAERSGDNTAEVGIQALERLLGLAIPVDLNGLRLNLLKAGVQKGLLELGVDSNDPLSGLQAQTSLLDILMVGLQVANKDSALSIPGTVLNLKPLADADIKIKIIEPPTLAAGRAGKDKVTGEYITRAHNGQVRAYIGLKALTSIGSGNSLLNLNLLLVHLKVSLPAGQAIELPINLEVGSADAVLEEIICYSKPNTHRARIAAKPGLAYLFLGSVPEALTNTTKPWNDLSKNYFNLLNLRVEANVLLGLIKLLDAPVKLKAKLYVPIENTNNYQSLDFDYAMDRPYSEQIQDLTKSVGSRQQIGQSIGNAINKNLLEMQLDTSGLSLLGLELKYLSDILDGLVNNLATIVAGVLPLVKGIVMPILSLLDSVLGPLLQLLGIQIGYADVQLKSVQCNPAQLVD